MKTETFFEQMDGIKEEYIVNAKAPQHKKYRKRVLPFVACVACFLLVIIVLFPYVQKDHFYKAVAAEAGKEELKFGATMPDILYYGYDKVIMYDYIGIWVYDLKKERLAGFCDFRPLHMTQIQGYPCVLVEASSDGKYVRFYQSDDSVKYLYDVKKDSYKEVESYDKEITWEMQLKDVSDTHSLSDYAYTYQIGKKKYLSYTLDIENTETLTYKDLVLLLEQDGKRKTYRPFS